MLKPHQQAFLDLVLTRGVLRFGDFTLKSGRLSPYFFNMGKIDTGAALADVGAAYAATAIETDTGFDMLFGPAYKGIPLAAATAIALARSHDRDVPWAYNRKEGKDHGEGGVLVGAPLEGRVLIVDDVITAGTAARESLALIRAAGARVAGILVALDRQERGQGDRSATQELAHEYGVPVTAIVDLADVMEYAGARPDLAAHRDRLRTYRDRYGIASG
ncbi:MAG TPA: orotate phosphoribosyltransferase [Rhodanobacteraceae bacterium]|jgi:orotate phosphoribosyltransferase|nr:orotate phosphoribosyltransferase [Rhodanobacteraceae bacterium]